MTLRMEIGWYMVVYILGVGLLGSVLIGMPFGAANPTSSLVYWAALIPQCLAYITIMFGVLAIASANKFVAVVFMITQLLAAFGRIFSLAVAVTSLVTCDHDGACDSTIRCDGVEPAPYVYAGPRDQFMIWAIATIVVAIIEAVGVIVAVFMLWSIDKDPKSRRRSTYE